MTRVLILLCLLATACPAQDPGWEGEWRVTWDRSGTDWIPQNMTGRLLLQREDARWTGVLEFDQAKIGTPVRNCRIDSTRARIELRPASGDERVELVLDREGDHVVGKLQWGESVPWSPIRGARTPRTVLVPGVVDAVFPRGKTAAGLAPAAWRRLRRNAEKEHTTALVILKDGKIVVEEYAENLTEPTHVAMSASKSIVSMAIGALIADGKLTLDTRISTLFPEWRGTDHEPITVKLLLNHTSGLDPARADFEKQTIRTHALRSPLVHRPGARFLYNNNAVDFLSVVFRRAAGVPLDDYLERGLFAELGIVGSSWMEDLEGNPRGAGELLIRPVDLAKLGQLMLDRGRWNGKSLLPSSWVDRSFSAGQVHNTDCGLLWWREMRGGTPRAYSAIGALGQFLVVVPGTRVVAVRMREARDSDYEGTGDEVDGYPGFIGDVLDL